MLLIENAAAARPEPPLDWHPTSARLFEARRGKLPALVRGLAAARGETVVIVDDDNVLAADYLERVATLFAEANWLGAVNGVVAAEFRGARAWTNSASSRTEARP